MRLRVRQEGTWGGVVFEATPHDDGRRPSAHRYEGDVIDVESESECIKLVALSLCEVVDGEQAPEPSDE